jgi:hypothetical protein
VTLGEIHRAGYLLLKDILAVGTVGGLPRERLPISWGIRHTPLLTIERKRDIPPNADGFQTLISALHDCPTIKLLSQERPEVFKYLDR